MLQKSNSYLFMLCEADPFSRSSLPWISLIPSTALILSSRRSFIFALDEMIPFFEVLASSLSLRKLFSFVEVLVSLCPWGFIPPRHPFPLDSWVPLGCAFILEVLIPSTKSLRPWELIPSLKHPYLRGDNFLVEIHLPSRSWFRPWGASNLDGADSFPHGAPSLEVLILSLKRLLARFILSVFQVHCDGKPILLRPLASWIPHASKGKHISIAPLSPWDNLDLSLQYLRILPRTCALWQETRDFFLKVWYSRRDGSFEIFLR